MTKLNELKMTDEGICPNCGYDIGTQLDENDNYWCCERCGWAGY